MVTGIDGLHLRVRAGNGYEYPVAVLAAMPGNFSVGDRVRAYGKWTAGTLRVDSLRVLRRSR